MNEENEWQGFRKEFADSLYYIANEVLYWVGTFLEPLFQKLAEILITLVGMNTEVIKELFGEAAPEMDMNFGMDEITEDDIACRRYGPNMVKVPK